MGSIKVFVFQSVNEAQLKQLHEDFVHWSSAHGSLMMKSSLLTGLEAYERTRGDERSDRTFKGGERAEIWCVYHKVYLRRVSGKIEHLLDLGDIPLVHSDRGGQVTYHGPGPIILYTLIPLKIWIKRPWSC